MQADEILVVDDSKLMHRMYEVMLRTSSLIHAHDGNEAEQLLAEHPEIKLVLLDLRLGQDSGVDVLRRIKADPSLEAIPVVVVGSYGDEDVFAESLEAGAASCLRKPFTMQELEDAIQRWL